MLPNEYIMLEKAENLASILKHSKCTCRIICDCCEEYTKCKSLRDLYYQLQVFIADFTK